MAYKLLNEKLRIYSCSIGDLTKKQIQNILEKWKDDAPIESLTVFYDVTGDNIVINHDFKDFELIYKTVEKFLNTPEEKIIECKSKVCPTISDVLDIVLRCNSERKAQKELKIIDTYMGTIVCTKNFVRDILYILIDKYQDAPILAMAGAYNLGKMHGKREERARRKKRINTP